MTYFNQQTYENLDALKREYKRLAKAHHPDHGGNTANFQELQREYAELLKGNWEKTYKTANESAIPPAMWDIIKKFMYLDTVELEVVGAWLWISGDTFSVKDSLKALGAKWSSTHKKWYYAETTKKRRATTKNFQTLEERHGATKVNRQHGNLLG